jgi:uncharacterized protein (DUF2132 family)
MIAAPEWRCGCDQPGCTNAAFLHAVSLEEALAKLVNVFGWQVGGGRITCTKHPATVDGAS